MNPIFTPGKNSLIAWAIVMMLAIIWTVSSVMGGTSLRSNVFELLPDADYDPLRETATRVVERELGSQLLFLIGHADRSVAKAGADRFSARLIEHPLIHSVTHRIDRQQITSIASFYFPYRRQLLSDEQLASIVSGGEEIVQNARAAMYSPLAAGQGDSLLKDPFFLLPDSLRELQPSSASLQMNGAHLMARHNDLNYVFVMARLASPALSIEEQESLALHLDGAAEPQLDILSTGFYFFAHAGTQSAKGEISVIGLGSLAGLLILVILTFRSLRPLSLIVVSILSGCLLALAITLAVFGYVHLFTLVFGASLIGVSVDYSFHYAAEDAFGGDDWTPERGLGNIFMGITLGLFTSVLAYLALTVAPFPGLQQLAVFSSAGLIGAYLTLLCCCKLWRRRLSVQRRSPALLVATSYLALWSRIGLHHRYLLVGVLAVAMLAGIRLIESNDDVAVLQSQPAELKRQEALIRDILGVDPGSTFLLAKASSDEELLQLEESIRERLKDMSEQGTLGGYQAVSSWVPSRARQARSFAAYNKLIATHLPQYFESLGVAEDAATSVVAELAQEMDVLALDDWLGHPVSTQFGRLWLEPSGKESASIILLYGLTDAAALNETIAGFPTVVVVNKAIEMSGLFGQYRQRVTWVLAGAYLVILLGLSFRYGLRRAAVLLIPPVFAGTGALALISLTGNTLNLFNLLALILVLGIGIDFTLFLAEASGDLQSTMFAITLSALTTMLSFGLLSLSSTYAVHSFGITVLLGIAIAYLLSPLVIPAGAELHGE